jgi:hypothetical protein
VPRFAVEDQQVNGACNTGGVADRNAAGVEIAYLTGYIRTSEQQFVTASGDEALRNVLEGYYHAWNAVKIDGTWYLVDATFDDAVAEGDPRKFRTTYLLTPPTWFRYDHLPEEPAWQLVAVPWSASEFVRQPLLTPAAGWLGLTLDAPARSRITVGDGAATVVFDNPNEAELLGQVASPGTQRGEHACETTHSARKTTVTCKLGTGELELRVFGGRRGARSYEHVGTILVNSR